jgi:hypothetical protein
MERSRPARGCIYFLMGCLCRKIVQEGHWLGAADDACLNQVVARGQELSCEGLRLRSSRKRIPVGVIAEICRKHLAVVGMWDQQLF